MTACVEWLDSRGGPIRAEDFWPSRPGEMRYRQMSVRNIGDRTIVGVVLSPESTWRAAAGSVEFAAMPIIVAGAGFAPELALGDLRPGELRRFRVRFTLGGLRGPLPGFRLEETGPEPPHFEKTVDGWRLAPGWKA